MCLRVRCFHQGADLSIPGASQVPTSSARIGPAWYRPAGPTRLVPMRLSRGWVAAFFMEPADFVAGRWGLMRFAATLVIPANRSKLIVSDGAVEYGLAPFVNLIQNPRGRHQRSTVHTPHRGVIHMGQAMRGPAEWTPKTV